MITYLWPPQSVSVSVPPVEFSLNGVDTTVSRDTVTPSNSRPLPIISLDSTGAVASPLTDTQLRASAVPVSGPLTDAQLRATAVPVSATSLPLPTGAATSANQALEITELQDIEADVEAMSAKLPATLGQKTMAASLAVAIASDQSTIPVSGPLTDAQLRATAVPVSAASLPLPSGASTLAEQQTQSTRLGDLTEVAPATDTASSGLNGRLQRIAQRLTSLIALFPLSLGQKTMANSFAVTLASDQSALSVTQTALTASYQEDTTVSNIVETFTAPAGAKWCKIQADSSNIGNLRVKIGAAATTTSGIILEPGRSEDFMAAGNISYCSTDNTGTDKIYVQYGA